MTIKGIINRWFKDKGYACFVKTDYRPPNDNDVLGSYTLVLLDHNMFSSETLLETQIGVFYSETDLKIAMCAFYKGLCIGHKYGCKEVV